ncbi:MAG: TRAP transporter permease [Bacillota bacterium]
MAQEQRLRLEEEEPVSKLNPFSDKLVYYLGIAMALFHLYIATLGLLPPKISMAIHLMFPMVMGFLMYPLFTKAKGKGYLVLDYLLAALGAVTTLYIVFNYQAILDRVGTPQTVEGVLGLLLTLLLLELGRRTMGWPMPILAVVFIAYALFGSLMPTAIAHKGLSLKFLANFLYTSGEGIFGFPIAVMTRFIFLFILFGALLQASGAGQVIIDIAAALTGRSKGGPAKVAVISSGLFGSISGSAIANVLGTGSFTIPMMKKLGYPSHFAAAVEAVASTGGTILPPVMGAVAFIMAEMMGVSYYQVAIAAIVPGVFYYISALVMVHLRACKLGMKGQPMEQLPNAMKIMKERGHLLIPLFVLVYTMFVMELSPSLSAVYACVSIVLVSYLKKDTRMSMRTLLDSLAKSGKTSAQVSAACALAGVIIGVCISSGLALRVSTILTNLSSGSTIMLLAFAMLSSIILGMGVTATVAYIMPAMLVVPALVNAGINPMAANLFILYFASISYITPPVALAAYAAAGIAGSDPFKTGFAACKLGIAGMFVPFLFVLNPALVLQGSVTEILMSIPSSFVGILMIAVAVEGWLVCKARWYERLLLVVGALLLLKVGLITDAIGVIILAGVYVLQKQRIKRDISFVNSSAQKA